MKNIKAIIFDAYGTLFDVNSAAEKCKDKIGDKWEGFANYWRTTQLEYTWLRSLMKKHKDFWQVTEDSLDKSMKAFNVDSSMRNELLNLYKILSPFEEVPKVLKTLKEKKLKLAIAESCTGGMLSSAITSVNGASKIFNLGLVTYSNQAKTSVLKVPKRIIQQYGAVSIQCCISMVNNLSKISKTKICVSITGID